MQVGNDCSRIFEHARPWPDEILFLGISADENRRRQLVVVHDDDDVIDRTGDGIAGGLVGDVEEFQRVDRDGDFKLTVDGGDGADMALGHTDLDVFDGVALFIDNLSADGNFFLRCEQDGQEDGCQR